MSINICQIFLSTQPEMADLMRSNGKIFVVVGVMVLIFLVLFVFLAMLDIRLRKLEKQNNK